MNNFENPNGLEAAADDRLMENKSLAVNPEDEKLQREKVKSIRDLETDLDKASLEDLHEYVLGTRDALSAAKAELNNSRTDKEKTDYQEVVDAYQEDLDKLKEKINQRQSLSIKSSDRTANTEEKDNADYKKEIKEALGAAEARENAEKEATEEAEKKAKLEAEEMAERDAELEGADMEKLWRLAKESNGRLKDLKAELEDSKTDKERADMQMAVDEEQKIYDDLEKRARKKSEDEELMAFPPAPTGTPAAPTGAPASPATDRKFYDFMGQHGDVEESTQTLTPPSRSPLPGTPPTPTPDRPSQTPPTPDRPATPRPDQQSQTPRPNETAPSRTETAPAAAASSAAASRPETGRLFSSSFETASDWYNWLSSDTETKVEELRKINSPRARKKYMKFVRSRFKYGIKELKVEAENARKKGDSLAYNKAKMRMEQENEAFREFNRKAHEEKLLAKTRFGNFWAATGQALTHPFTSASWWLRNKSDIPKMVEPAEQAPAAPATPAVEAAPQTPPSAPQPESAQVPNTPPTTPQTPPNVPPAPNAAI